MEKQFLVPFIRTDFERDSFVEQAHKVIEAVTGKRQSGTVKEQLVAAFDGELANTLLTDYQAAGMEAGAWLKQLVATVEQWQVLQLTVAVRPTERLITRVSTWLMTTMGRPVVVGYHYEPSVLGGAIVEWEGAYVNLTLGKKLNNYIAHYDFRQFLGIQS